MVRESACSAETTFDPGFGKIPGEGNVTSSILGRNSMGRGLVGYSAWIAKSQTRLEATDHHILQVNVLNLYFLFQ